MTISFLSIFFIVIAFVCGGVMGYLIGISRCATQARQASERESEYRAQAAAAVARAETLSRHNEQLSEQSAYDTQVLQVLAPLTQQLEQVTTHMHRMENTAASQHSQIVAQLRREEQLYIDLAHTTSSLNAALRSGSARGSWGEVQLRRIIEAAGMMEHVDFDMQTSSSKVSSSARSAGRPDAIVHLPGDAHIPLDSKVPMDSYLEAMEIPAEDLSAAAERNELLTQHAKAVRRHIDSLAKRNYPNDFPHSPQLTILFLPAESLLSHALHNDATLLEYAMTRNIVLASPTSLLALLRSIAAVWAADAISHEAHDIIELGQTLLDRLSVVLQHLHQLGKSLGQSVSEYNKTIGSLESRLLATARSFQAINHDGLPCPSHLDDTHIRPTPNH
ncbi:DNA recombination protein RmuC [Trueperella sp. LYQ143]|uniref:DNA recombination protein RmuC n=1 Tax=unclassified Trueperella TaxID=2630174 RepID=UPI003983BF38